jgi:hypothetical protein
MTKRSAAGAQLKTALSAPLTAAIAAMVLSSVGAAPAHAQTDIAVFKNGDRLTGEIKSLDRGKVSFDTPATGVINLEWDDIDRMLSRTTFEFTLDTGEMLYGTLAETTGESQISVQTESGTRDFATEAVVRMTPIKSTIKDRIEMSIDAGYSLAQANDLVQTNLGYDFRYREEKRQISFSADGSMSSSENEPSSTRVYSSGTYRRFLSGSGWDPFGIGQYERNDELGIDRRTSLGGGMSRWLRDTNSNRIVFGGGLIRSFEDDAGSTETKTDTEALIAMDFEWFRYDEPELDVRVNFSMYRRLSGTGDPRGNLDVNFRWELFKDFFWGFSVYYSYDQQTEDADATTDYGSFTSLGWKF